MHEPEHFGDGQVASCPSSGYVPLAALLEPPRGMLRLMRVTEGLRVGVATALWLLLLPACTGSSEEEDCGPNAGCGPSFRHEGVLYSIGCLGVAPEKVGPDLPPVEVNSTGEVTPLRLVTGWSAGQALAVRVPTTGCGNPGDGSSEWRLSFPLGGPEGWSENDRVTCDVALAGPSLRQSLRCDQRG